jgi:hypothetical protein
MSSDFDSNKVEQIMSIYATHQILDKKRLVNGKSSPVITILYNCIDIIPFVNLFILGTKQILHSKQ